MKAKAGRSLRRFSSVSSCGPLGGRVSPVGGNSNIVLRIQGGCMKRFTWLVAALLLAPCLALAQQWPAKGKELKVVVGYPPGSGADTSVRFYAAKLAELISHPVIVENRAGMISSIGADAVAKAQPDGYTILLASVTSSHAANLVLFKKLPYDPVKDFTPVTTLYRTTFFLMVNASAP